MITLSRDIPEFGERIAGNRYKPRPGAYALVLDDEQRIAVVRTPQGLFLPGGGIDVGETAEAALHREVREECGWLVTIKVELGRAVEYVFAEGEGHFAKQCTFYLAELTEFIGGQIELDHQVEWATIRDAQLKLTLKSQAWAVEQFAQRQHTEQEEEL